jgi:hypothetical protein
MSVREAPDIRHNPLIGSQMAFATAPGLKGAGYSGTDEPQQWAEMRGRRGRLQSRLAKPENA